MSDVGRNAPCPCGSGKKTKHCCGTGKAAPLVASSAAATHPDQLLERAVLHHRRSEFSQAEALYRQVLLNAPEHPDALHLLGVIAAQNGAFAQSAQLIERAIRQNPANPAFHTNLGNAYRQLDADPARCISCYRRAIKLDPGYLQAHNNLGNALKLSGDLAAALSSYQRALNLQPTLLEAALGKGNVLLSLERHAEAVETFRQLSQRHPDCSAALVGLGSAQLALGQNSEAESSLLQALRLDRSNANAYYNLGLVLRAQERQEPAAESLAMAIKLQPDFKQAYYHLGLALQGNNLHQAAEEAFHKALELDNGNPLILLSLADTMAALGNTESALDLCRQVITADPQNGNAHCSLGLHLCSRGDLPGAVESLRRAQALGTNSPTLLHMLAALEGETPKTANPGYVTEVFDGYAARFDKHLVEGLGYDSPSHLLQLARQYNPATAQCWRVLDLGCGTGLCGVAFAPCSTELVGVDLSGKMLDKARERNIYQRLVQADLLGMMQGEATADYDLVIAADVFVYIGDLAEIHEQARRLLVPGGLFLYSVESSDALLDDETGTPDSDYRLLLSGRYAHAASYLRRLAADNSLRVMALESRTLRMENKAPITGWCVVLASQEG